MDVVSSSSSAGESLSNSAPVLDPRLQPTPDYGTLGPGSDVARHGQEPDKTMARKVSPTVAQWAAIAVGMFAAMLAGAIGSIRTRPSTSPSRQSQPATPKDLRQLDRMKPQKQAETLLELAVGHSDGAVEQISSRADRWQGKIAWNQQIASLSTAALNSNDLRVRQSGVEVELAAYGLSKNSASLEYLLRTADSVDHTQKIWALWALGLMGNRGIETGRVVEVLNSHLKDSDADSRRWAVESLALTGSDQAIQPLLQTMHDDSTPLVRERAACSLAESGLFTPEQRFSAIPQLLSYSDDPTLDAKTQAWAFQALGDITHQHLPNNSAAWRNWYDSGPKE